MPKQPPVPLHADHPTFTIETSEGSVSGQLFPKHAPVTVANFASYAKARFYEDLIFHRVIQGFMVQGGGIARDGRPKKGNAPIRLETSPALAHWDAALSMARTQDPNSATSQFFICHGPQASLDKNYAVFGVATGGLDVVDRIARMPTDRDDKPAHDIVIRSVKVTGI